MVFKHQQFYEAPPEIEVEFPGRATLEATVSDALASTGGIDASDVTVTASGTTITLSGSVLRQEELVRADEIARSIEGVTKVRNDIAVTGLDQVQRGI
ncbi:BON domain-containing protein [Rhizobium wenxiniae]|uniref:BON domain-containing protein n=1 Tax=Rhizobium wenxiniae TaxID=1737357 RepID=UPI003C29682F